jgi:hypothetical protein
VKVSLFVAALVLTDIASGAARSAAETIRPGYWEATETVLSPIQTTKVERRCIDAKQVEKFMSCYINGHYSCVCPEQSYADGQIRYRGICTDRKGAQVGIVGRGNYTATTLHVTADVTFSLAGLPITGQAATDAHRIADDCPAEPSAK